MDNTPTVLVLVRYFEDVRYIMKLLADFLHPRQSFLLSVRQDPHSREMRWPSILQVSQWGCQISCNQSQSASAFFFRRLLDTITTDVTAGRWIETSKVEKATYAISLFPFTLSSRFTACGCNSLSTSMTCLAMRACFEDANGTSTVLRKGRRKTRL